MSLNLNTRDEVIDYLANKTNSSQRESERIINDLENNGLIKFDITEGVSLKQLVNENPRDIEDNYYMPKILMLDPNYKKISIESKLAYSVLADKLLYQGEIK